MSTLFHLVNPLIGPDLGQFMFKIKLSYHLILLLLRASQNMQLFNPFFIIHFSKLSQMNKYIF